MSIGFDDDRDTGSLGLATRQLDWRERLTLIVQTMREMSRLSDPQLMTAAYSARMQKLFPTDRFVAISRREMQYPEYRITRCSLWEEMINPWRERERLPVFSAGLLGDLLYGEEPRILDEIDIAPDDPGAEYFEGMKSLIAIPHYDGGQALNMVVLMRKEPGAFAPEEFPEVVWMSNLFGRATHSLVMAEKVKEAYEAVDQEMRIVANIQRSLLPAQLPTIPTLELAAHYQTSHRAGGDYYDFFPLAGGRWGFLIADISGHGIPAAVMMAITHAIAHTYTGPMDPPVLFLSYINRHLTRRYTAETGSFVTAFYAIFDPTLRTITYSSAGHHPPRLKRCTDGSMVSLDGVQRLPMGILPEERYPHALRQLYPGDQLIFFTDGVTEAEGPDGELFGLERLDRVLGNCSVDAESLLQSTLDELDRFTEARPATDDRTLMVAKVT